MRVPGPIIGLSLTVACVLLTPPSAIAAPAEPTADGWSAEAVIAAREQLTDLLASEDVDRLDFRARTLEEAIGLIGTTVGAALEHNRDEFATAEEAARFIQRVTVAFDTHKPRGLGWTFPDASDHSISDGETATKLGELLGISAAMVHQYVGPDASPERISEVGTNLFRHVSVDSEGGLTYLDQYLDGLVWIAGRPLPGAFPSWRSDPSRSSHHARRQRLKGGE